jgi:hypothetical protein
MSESESESETIVAYGITEHGPLVVYDKKFGRIESTREGYIKYIKNDESTLAIDTFNINRGPICIYKEEDGDISEEPSLSHSNVIYMKKSKGGRKLKKLRKTKKTKKGKKMSRRF